MKQFSIKNDRAVELLDSLTERTGKGKTQVVLEALESYDQNLRHDPEMARLIRSIKENVHALMNPDVLRRTPTKEEIEEELGMP